MMTMKITNADVIKTGEQELIDAITADLDWGVIEKIFRKEHKLGIEEEIEYKKGDIVAYNNQIAYRLEFEVKVNLAVLLNREGEYISINVSEDEDETDDDTEDAPLEGSVDVGDKNQENTMDTSSAPIQKNDTANDDNFDPDLKNDDKVKGDDAFKEALNELDSMDAEEDDELSEQDRSADETADKISQLASRVGKLIKKEKKG
jgi:hypothetical protein